MKNNKKLFTRLVTTFLTMCLLCAAASAVGSVTTKTLNATFKNIKIVLNGVQIDPKDASGNIVEPFVSDGTTYLPVRAVANALGLDVKWDGETSTVYLGDIPGEGVNWMKKLPPYQVGRINSYGYGSINTYDGSDERNYFSVGGEKKTIGIVMKDDVYALWNTNLNYKSITFTVGNLDKNQRNNTLEVYLDGEYSTSYDLVWDRPPQTITVPLNYAANLKLMLKSGGTFALYDISFAE